MVRFVLAVFICVIAPVPALACRLALALALDVSGSVDGDEYRLQFDGLAEALGDSEVQDAIFALPTSPVALAIFEWSSSRYQRMVQDWVVLADLEDLEVVRHKLQNWTRESAPESTGLGAALRFGRELIDRGPDCWDQTLDVSGDGRNNDWPSPVKVRSDRLLGDLRINGLVIAESPEDGSQLNMEARALAAYFEARVIQGPGSFVEVALGFHDYADAMQRKLLRELSTMMIGQVNLPSNNQHLIPAQ